MIASLLSEDAYSMFCLSAAMRVLLPENAMPIFIIDVTFIACKSTLYARSLICCKATLRFLDATCPSISKSSLFQGSRFSILIALLAKASLTMEMMAPH